MKRRWFLTLTIALVAALCFASVTVAYAGGGDIQPLADGDNAPATITLTEHENKFYALPNGKGWNELKTAYENALNTINAEIKAIHDESGDLAQALQEGRIPFYSKENDGYITVANLEGGFKYGEKWLNENIAQDALPVYRLTEGFNPTAREPQAALIVFNAKATNTTGTNGVFFVTGAFAAKWSGEKGGLGLAIGNTFSKESTVYQNFQRGYLKKVGGGDVEIVKDKNVNEEGQESDADLNATGWFGASGNTAGEKNRINAADEDEVKAFSAMASAYYDALREKGLNLGYSGNNEVSFGMESIRGATDYPLTNFYRGNMSVAAPYGTGDSRRQWLALAYNKELNKIFVIKDEVLFAMENATNADDNNSWTGVRGLCKMGAPASELFAVNNMGKRYQDFGASGYVEVNGLTAQNTKDTVTVHKSTDSGYKSLKDLLTEEYNAVKGGDAKDAFENPDLYESGADYESFKTIYETAVPQDAEAIGNLIDALTEAMEKLVLLDPKPALDKIVGEVNAVNNDEHIYTSVSFTAFQAAVTEAANMSENDNVAILAKTKAYKATLDLLVKFADIVPTYTVEKNSEEFFAFPNGKGYTDFEAAFNAAFAHINKEIGYIMDGRTLDESKSDLDAAVASGRIPFYSLNNGGYLIKGNTDAFGEQWMGEHAKHNALVLYNLNDGVDARGAGWFRDGNGAFMVFNAKAEAPYSGRSGVIFVAGNFVGEWNQKDLGMPNADAFTENGVKYQNFQKGYLKDESGVVSKVLYKNIEEDSTADGGVKEVAAYSNASGWFGATGIKGYKNALGFTGDNAEQDAKAFSKALSEYYDEIWKSGYNPGYSFSNLNDPVVFEGANIRGSEFKVDNLYHGDSVAVCYGDDRPNWTAIAYNSTEKKFYLIRDEILYAMEGKDNYGGSLEIGAPVSEVFTVAAGDKAGRYQAFENGYIYVPSAEPKNDYNITVTKAEAGEGKAELTALLKSAFETFKTETEDELNAGSEAYYQGFEDFEAAYNATLDTNSSMEDIATALENLVDAHAKLITQALYDEYEAAINKVNAAGEGDTPNADKKYTSASFTAFTEAAAAAIELPTETAAEMQAAIDALNDALDLLVTTESVYDAAKAQADAILTGNNENLYYTGTSFAAFKTACEAIQAPASGDYEAMETAIAAYGAAMEELDMRLEMGDLGVQNKTLEIGENFTVNVTGEGDGEVTVVIESGDAATLAGNVLTAVKTGSVTLKITKAGGNDYYDKSVTVTVTVTKKTVSAPTAAEIESTTESSITVKAVEGAEYRIGDGEWQASNVFTGLEAGKEYVVYVRFAETATENASDAASVKATTQSAASDGEGCGCGSVTDSSAWLVAAVLLVLAAVVIAKKGRKQHE